MQLVSKWEQKALYGKYVACCKHTDADEKRTHQWLHSSGLMAYYDRQHHLSCWRSKLYWSITTKPSWWKWSSSKVYILQFWDCEVSYSISGYKDLTLVEKKNQDKTSRSDQLGKITEKPHSFAWKWIVYAHHSLSKPKLCFCYRVATVILEIHQRAFFSPGFRACSLGHTTRPAYFGEEELPQVCWFPWLS